MILILLTAKQRRELFTWDSPVGERGKVCLTTSCRPVIEL